MIKKIYFLLILPIFKNSRNNSIIIKILNYFTRKRKVQFYIICVILWTDSGEEVRRAYRSWISVEESVYSHFHVSSEGNILRTWARSFANFQSKVSSSSCRRQRQDISAPSRVSPRPLPGGRKQSGKFGRQVSSEEVCLPRQGLAFASRKRNINFPSGSSVSPLAALFISTSNRRNSDRKFPSQYFIRAESRRKFQRLTVVLTNKRVNACVFSRLLLAKRIRPGFAQHRWKIYSSRKTCLPFSTTFTRDLVMSSVSGRRYNDRIIKMLHIGWNEM